MAGFRTWMVRDKEILFVFFAIASSLPAFADSPSKGIFEPYLGYEAGTYKAGAFIPGFTTIAVNKSVRGFSGGARIGTKKEKGYWGIGAEIDTASVGATNLGFVKPFDLGIFLTRYWRGGFRIRATGIPYAKLAETRGMGFKLGFGILVKENISINLDYIYRHYYVVTEDLPRATVDGRIVTGFLSVGFPFGEENIWRQRTDNSY